MSDTYGDDDDDYPRGIGESGYDYIPALPEPTPRISPAERAKKILDEARLSAISDAALQNKIADAIQDAVEAYKHSLGQDMADPPVDYISPISGLPNKWPK